MKNGFRLFLTVMSHALSLPKNFIALVFLVSALCALGVPTQAAADDLGEHILAAILRGEKPSDAALLLLTGDLKWYEQNMGKLNPDIQNRVQQLRVNVGAQSSQMAARKLNEPGSVFAATGSWKPGRDMDIIYFGKHGDHAATVISESYETATGRILATAGDDPILQSFRRTGGTIPKSLSSESLAVCTTELPDYGYSDLEKAYKKAKEAIAKGESREDVLNAFRNDARKAMQSNVKAHFAAMSNPDYYAGATGQEWFRKTYLEDTEKMRVFARNADGDWALQPGGIKAVPEEIVERLGFGSFGPAGQVKFSKIASDYSLFFSHMHGGPADNAKYAMRVWTDMGLNAIQDLSDGELRVLAAAKVISKNPNRAAQILSEMGIGSVDEFNAGIARILHGWTESQLVLNMERIVAELSASSGKSIDEVEKLLRQSKASMELNEIVAGLSKLGAVPNGKAIQTQLMERLQTKFGNTESGKAAIRVILKNLGLLGDSGELTARIVRMLARAGKITDAEAAAFEAGGPLSGRAQAQVNQVKKELLVLNAGGMVEFDSTLDLEQLMSDWRSSQPGAILQNADDDIRAIINELQDAPDSKLKALGWTAEEIALQNKLRNQLRANKQMMPSLGARLEKRLAKAGIRLSDVRADIRKMMFNPEYTKLGDPSVSVGAFDAVVGSAAALYQTHTILNGPAMKEEDETIALSNAWVTAIPVVGDFAQSLITGSEGYWEGDKGKMVDAGLWMAIGVTGMIPGGQLPAVVSGLLLATKPAAQGIYDARQAQNLVQVWIESGKWSPGKPAVLEGIYDRNGLLHRLNYEEILGSKGEVKYDSTKIKSLPFGEFTIAQSVRDYANRYVLAGNKQVEMLRENLKTLFPDLGDKVLNNLEHAETKLSEKKSKLATMFFKAYERQVRGAYIQTIAHLKKWAEDERRVAKDYEGEVARLRAELAALEKELKNVTLVKHADETVNSYSRMATNLFEQESLPLSKVRIYENTIATYKQIRDQLRSVSELFSEASSHFVPTSWFLTGYPVFDKDMADRLLKLMNAERTRVGQQVEQLLKDLNQKDTHLNLRNECHQKAFDIIATQRYRIAFTQHLSEYYRALAGESSRWSDAYASAKASYESTRDSLLKLKAPPEVVVDKAFTDAFTTFFFAMAFSMASHEADAYRRLGDDYEARLVALREHDKSDRLAGTESDAGKALQQCLKTGLLLEIQLSTTEPKAGTNVDAVVKLTKGSLPKETSWAWVTSGGLTASPRFGEKTVVRAASEGELTVRLMDERYTNKVLSEAKVRIVPKKDDAADKPREKEQAEKEKAEKEKVERERAEREKADEEKARKERAEKEPPKVLAACSYKYSEWGECSRATSRQTRTVIAKEPPGCVEQGEPDLIQECTPPPTEAMARESLMQCLCRCTGDRYHYDPSICITLHLPGVCHISGSDVPGIHNCYFIKPTSQECVRSCYESIYRKKPTAEDLAWIDKEIRAANKKAMKPLQVKLNYSQCPVRAPLGEVVNFSATIDGGMPPHKISWSGEGQAKDKQFTFVNTRQPGTHDITVTVNDSEGSTATATCQVIVDAVAVEIEKTSPPGNNLPIGSRATFKAIVKSGQKPAAGSFRYRWQPHPEVQFGDDKNPLFETTTPSTTALYKKLGSFDMSVTVLRKVGDTYQTVGESNQIQMIVSPPKLKLTANNPTPKIGDSVLVTVAEEPRMSDDTIGFRWELAGQAENPGPVPNIPNNRAYSCTPKDSKPLKVTVHAKAKDGGDDLGQAELTISAKAFTVKVSEPRLQGPKPRIWKDGVGLVEVEGGIAVLQDFSLRAEVSPAPAKQPLSYSWSIEPSGCGMPGAGQEIRVNCSQVGSYEARVVVRDSQGIQLGSGSGPINVNVSQDELDRAGKTRDASAKLARAKELAALGKLDEAIATADEAAALDPRNKDAAALAGKLRSQKTEISKQLEKVKKLITESNFAEAQKELAVAKGAQGKYAPVLETEKLLNEKLAEFNKGQKEVVARQARKLKEEGAALEKQGKPEEALGKYRESLKLVPDSQLEERIRTVEKQIAVQKESKEKKETSVKPTSSQPAPGATESDLKYVKGFAGKWSSNFGLMEIKVEAGRVIGSYTHDNGRIEATLSGDGKTMEGKWSEAPSYKPPSDAGRVTFRLSEDQKTITGRWWYGQDGKGGDWTGTRVGEAEARKIRARELKAAGEKLEQAGKPLEAVAKYKESLGASPDPDLEKRVKQLETRETKPSPADHPADQEVNAILGEWKLSSGGLAGTAKERVAAYTGSLVFSLNNGRLTGKLSLSGSWEELKNVSFRNGVVAFDRPIPGVVQNYRGKLQDRKRIDGTFTHKNESYGWWAQKP